MGCKNMHRLSMQQLIQSRLAELGVTGWAINVEVIEQDYDPEVIAEVEKLKQASSVSWPLACGVWQPHPVQPGR